MKHLKTAWWLALSAAASTLSPMASAAFPERPITLVVPYAPGGITDNFSRAIADGMSRELGQTVVVENKPGASATIGTSAVARAPADGYTLLLGSNGTLILNPIMRKNISYDAQHDFQVFSLAGELPTVLLTNLQTPVTTLREFNAYAKNLAGKVNYASVGAGNILHLASEKLKSEMNVDMTQVAYKGSSPALMALMGNEVQFMTDVVPSSLTLIQAGKVKPLAVVNDKRISVLPDVPTIEEAGYAKFHAPSWMGLAVPAGTPPDVVVKLQAAANKALQNPQLRTTFGNLGLEMMEPLSDAQIASYLEADRQRWQKIVKDNNIALLD